jgi:DNA repair exonuclease SbcCD ATPase subunit
MIFNSISLENFGVIKKFSKQFDKNILVLAGENGNGKSTILKAILLAVFDDYEGVLADYVNWDSSYFQVIVNFTHRGIDYESVVRYEGATDRTLRFGDKVLKGDEAKRKLKDIVDVDLLKAGMLAMEQEIAIVKTKPAERREYLKRIYDIEFKRQLADIENDIKISELELAGKTALQSEIENRKYTIPEKPEFPFDKTGYDLIKANLEIERSKLHAAEESIRIYEQTRSELSGLEDQSANLSETVKRINDKINRSQIELTELPEAKNKAFSMETSVLNGAENELKAADDEFVNKHKALSDDLNGIVLERLPAFNLDEFNTISQELYVKKSKLTELESAKDVCPACGQSISSPEHIERRKQETLELAGQIGELTVRFEMAVNQKFKREQADKNNLEKTNRRTSLQHQLSLLEEKNKSDCFRIQSKIDSARNNMKNLDAKFAAEETRIISLIDADSDNKNNLTAQLNEVTAKIAKARDTLEGMKTIPLDSIKSRIQKFESDIRLYEDTASRIAEIERMEARIAVQKEKDAKQLEEVRSEIQVLNELIGNWKLGIKILKTEFPVYVISRVIKDIEKAMNEFLKRTYPKYYVEVQDRKNALHIVYGPKKKDVSSASGFERQIFSLSFMYAISRATGNKCWILDEADSAATEKNSGIFYRVLGESMGQGIDQAVIVSHKPATRSILEFDYNAEVITFENGAAA